MENNEEERKISITLEDGSKAEGEILFSFEANGDEFVLYVIDEEVFAAKIDENENLSPVSEDEWPLVEKIYDQFMEDLEEEKE